MSLTALNELTSAKRRSCCNGPACRGRRQGPL